jgi:hypothetical protein
MPESIAAQNLWTRISPVSWFTDTSATPAPALRARQDRAGYPFAGAGGTRPDSPGRPRQAHRRSIRRQSNCGPSRCRATPRPGFPRHDNVLGQQVRDRTVDDFRPSITRMSLPFASPIAAALQTQESKGRQCDGARQPTAHYRREARVSSAPGPAGTSHSSHRPRAST